MEYGHIISKEIYVKKLFFLLVAFELSACAAPTPEPTPTPEEIATQADSDLLADGSIMAVLKFYEKIYGSTFFPFNAICSQCEYCGYNVATVDKLIEYSTTIPADNIHCLHAYCDTSPYASEYANYTDNSDECILVRRTTKPSKISYFNYKKYILNHNGLKSEDDFINLYKMYSALMRFNRDNRDNDYIDMNLIQKYVVRECVTQTELTTSEYEACAQETEKFLADMAAGRAQKCSAKYPKQWNAWKNFYLNSGTYQYVQFGALNLCIPDKLSEYDNY